MIYLSEFHIPVARRSNMNSRERVIEAINHRQPDYVPMDLGGCGQTGINASSLYLLRKAYGLDEHPIKICEPLQLLGEVELDLIQKIGADVISLPNRGNFMGLSNRLEKTWNMPDGTPTVMPDNFEYDILETGEIMVYPCGDRSAPYATHMPADGTFFDNIYRSPPVDEDNLTPLEDFKESYQLKTEEDCIFWESESKRLYNETEFAIMGALSVSPGDWAELPGPALRYPKGIRTLDAWLMAHLLYPDYVRTIFEYHIEVGLKNLEMYRQAVGDRIQVLWLCGTDFGTQSGLMCSKDVFNDLYRPYLKKLNDWVHKNTSWKIFYHCCGAISTLIPDFIDIGVDILNPVQCSAAGMDPKSLKDAYGDKIVFWGGGVDTQKTLPLGSPKDVYEQVLERLNIFAPGGGFVFATIHNILAKISPENIIAMYDALNEYRGRK
jgi:hypothetical protein